jgi:glycine cleavage system H protein
MSATYFTKDHEWIRIEGLEGTVGITDYAQKQLGDIVYVELPETGKKLTQGAEAAVVESVKAASEVYSPVGGTVSAVNDQLTDAPALVNESAGDRGWFFRIDLADAGQLDGLMDQAAYDEYLNGLE